MTKSLPFTDRSMKMAITDKIIKNSCLSVNPDEILAELVEQHCI
ncbi:hypothetical protein NQ504_09405 [Ligilactobacillus ruminis]|nr:hypothetical protein [Ligilactobacillus ruminis]EGX98758.1 hypothetical protein ANHS_678 [Ligilactobacillus ruminis ATCC 25644]UWP39917.1 hypothetical protein NQ504_09405 [Ligilactobacillus ruminis]